MRFPERPDKLPRSGHLSVLGAGLVALCPQAYGQGGDFVVYEGRSPTAAYEARVTMHEGPGEKYSWWEMDVRKDGRPLVSGCYFSPFYAWTCVNRGRAKWVEDSFLQFTCFSAQGRNIGIRLRNASGGTVTNVEVMVRSMDAKGYPHSPAIFEGFDVRDGREAVLWSEIFPGAEYFVVRCECRGQTAVARFRIPFKPGAPHDIDDGTDPRKEVTVTLTPQGPVISGTFDALTDPQARALVPGKERLHLIEEKRDHRQTP